MVEKLSVQWNDFSTNLSSGFHGLLTRGDLADVTFLADGQFIKAHRLVLSICSPYFQEMFVRMPANQHAFVFLKDVNHSVLKDLLLFMYCGEVKINEENLREFVNIAETFQIKGLTALQSQTGSTQKRMYSEASISSLHSPAEKRTKFNAAVPDPLSDELEPGSVETIRTKIEPPDFVEENQENPTDIEFNENNRTETYNQEEQYYESSEQETYSEHEMFSGTFSEPLQDTPTKSDGVQSHEMISKELVKIKRVIEKFQVEHEKLKRSASINVQSTCKRLVELKIDSEEKFKRLNEKLINDFEEQTAFENYLKSKRKPNSMALYVPVIMREVFDDEFKKKLTWAENNSSSFNLKESKIGELMVKVIKEIYQSNLEIIWCKFSRHINRVRGRTNKQNTEKHSMNLIGFNTEGGTSQSSLLSLQSEQKMSTSEESMAEYGPYSMKNEQQF